VPARKNGQASVDCGYCARSMTHAAGDVLTTVHRGACLGDANCRSVLACSWECVQALATNLVCTTGAATAVSLLARQGIAER
jgi:hypothetical protein